MNDKNYWRDKWREKKRAPANAFARRAWARFGSRRYKTLLDVGCGDGRDAVYFARKGLTVTAVDYSKSGIERVRAANPGIRAFCTDVREMRFPRESFDVIYAHLSLHYFSDADTKKIFENLRRMLKKGGRIFVKCKSVDDALYGEGVKIAADTYRRGHTRHFFSKDYMARMMRGFEILSLRRTSSTYHRYKSAFIEAVATKQ